LALADSLLELQELTKRLRRDCPWDREQTARTIVPHTVEEAYEVADAAIAERPDKLLDELGDLLYQVYFLALLLEDRARATGGGARGPRDSRHPHVFGERNATAGARNWERIAGRRSPRRNLPRRPRVAAGALWRASPAPGGGDRLEHPDTDGALGSRRRASQ
jgi:NTP pyrophosphatase (non-canonical NTP hydrolase)